MGVFIITLPSRAILTLTSTATTNVWAEEDVDGDGDDDDSESRRRWRAYQHVIDDWWHWAKCKKTSSEQLSELWKHLAVDCGHCNKSKLHLLSTAWTRRGLTHCFRYKKLKIKSISICTWIVLVDMPFWKIQEPRNVIAWISHLSFYFLRPKNNNNNNRGSIYI